MKYGVSWANKVLENACVCFYVCKYPEHNGISGKSCVLFKIFKKWHI